jgi:hypothetical protein
MSATITPVTSTLDTASEALSSHQPGAELGSGQAGAASDAIGAELVRLLAESPSAVFEPQVAADASDASAYDGHVALALDIDVLPQIDSTLDLLTSSHQLFDVPALDVASVLDDSLPT